MASAQPEQSPLGAIIVTIGNLFTNTPSDIPEELVETLVEDRQVRIERIVSTGQSSPEGFWYDQEDDEWVAVLKGEARLLFEDGSQSIHMKPGDHLTIAAHRKHRIEWTSSHEPTVWLAVFYNGSSGRRLPPREQF